MFLDRLPPELLSHILHRLDSPRDLHHLISASPSCLRVFSTLTVPILSSVIRNALPGDNLRRALAVLQAPSSKDHDGSFLEDYFTSTFDFDFPTEKADIVVLCRLYNRVSYFVDRYFEDTMREFGVLSPQSAQALCEPSKTVHHLSLSERTRLQRAFLHFELYCRVFFGHLEDPFGRDRPPGIGVAATNRNMYSWYLNCLAPWEIEEMACVEQYLSSFVGDAIEDLEEDFISAAKTAAAVVLPDCSADTLRGIFDFQYLGPTTLELFSYDGRRLIMNYISSMTSIGLDFVYTLINADKVVRSRMIRSNNPVSRELFPEARLDAPTATDSSQQTGILATGGSEDKPSRCNLGFRLFCERAENLVEPDDLVISYTPLRHLGFVFWDDDRVQFPQISKALFAAGKMPLDEVAFRFGRTQRRPAEGRLKGIKLPIEEITRLDKEYGSLLGFY